MSRYLWEPKDEYDVCSIPDEEAERIVSQDFNACDQGAALEHVLDLLVAADLNSEVDSPEPEREREISDAKHSLFIVACAYAQRRRAEGLR